VTTPAEEPAPEPEVNEAALGGPGESCRARKDCQSGLRCLNAVCTDPHLGESCGATADCGEQLRCIQNICGGPQPGQAAKPAPTEAEAEAEEDSGASIDEWIAHPMWEGIGGFVGLNVLGGVGWAAPLSGGASYDVEGAFLFGLRGGLLINRIELGLEFSPVTYLPYPKDGAEPHLQLNGTFGYHVPLSDQLTWPIRVGVGVVAVNTEDPLFQARADLLGLSIGYGHLLIDTHFPSFRFLTEFDRVAFFDWLVGAGISYAF
jgi:hypothetical protein